MAWDGTEQLPPLGTATEMSTESNRLSFWSLPAALPSPPLPREGTEVAPYSCRHCLLRPLSIHCGPVLPLSVPPVMVPSGHGANADHRTLSQAPPAMEQPGCGLGAGQGAGTRSSWHSRAAGHSRGWPAPQVPGEAGGEPGCATRPPRTGQAGPASLGATLRGPEASPSEARCQGAGQGAGCPTAGNGFRAGIMQPRLEAGGSDILLPMCQPRLGQ